ncbi:CbiX/SirB N-terminal domain-containing protein [Kribbella hippodromi]|uniref:CbiX/SirB N-terminal domain-containing protein n=1 Tax=Kribbella hippodromi TaxID=434347 RepID=A0ABP4Q1L3_9ACTN
MISAAGRTAVQPVDLVAVAHGTADPGGIRVVHELVRLMARARPEVAVSLGFVDLLTPALPSLVRRITADTDEAVAVPLLLSAGYHVYVDIAAEANRYPNQLHTAPALGPDPALADILTDRLAACFPDHYPAAAELPVDQVVLAAAGSSDPRALRDCEETAGLLSARIARPVTVGYLSGAGERLQSVLARTKSRLAVATYLLAPGFFADRTRRLAGPHPVSAPLGADPRLAALALHRYDQALANRQLPQAPGRLENLSRFEYAQ